MGYEHDVVHPVTAKWLVDNGYTYQHEVTLPVGQVDFLAEHPNGQKLLVECKSSSNGYLNALRQIFDYRYQLGASYDAALAIPKDKVTNAVIQACNTRKVHLIQLSDLEDVIPLNNKLTDEQYLARTCMLIVWKYVIKIQSHHEVRRTNPRFDLWELQGLVTQLGNEYSLPSMELIGKALSECDETLCDAYELYMTSERVIQFVFEFIR